MRKWLDILTYHCATSDTVLFRAAFPSTQKVIPHFILTKCVFESNLRCVSDHVLEALHFKDTVAGDQTDREDHLKLGKCLETAEDNVHSREREIRKIII